MKAITSLILFLLATAVLVRPADVPAAAFTNTLTGNPMSWPRGTVLGMNRGGDGRTLIVRYEFTGRTNEQTIIITNTIATFHYCSYYEDRGVGFALSDTQGEVYWATAYYSRLAHPLYPRKIRSPYGCCYRLMGIACSGGDTIAITAMDLRCKDGVLARGWIYENGCAPGWSFFLPPTNAPAAQIQTSNFDNLIEFEIPTKQAETKK